MNDQHSDRPAEEPVRETRAYGLSDEDLAHVASVGDGADFEPAPEPRTGWHPVNVGHFVMGASFIGLVAVWALFTAGIVDSDNLRWLMPLPWVAAGCLGLLALVLRNTRRDDAI